MTQTLTTFYGKNQNADTLTTKIKNVLDTETNVLITHLTKDLFKQLMPSYQFQASLVIILPILKLILMFTNKKMLNVRS